MKPKVFFIFLMVCVSSSCFAQFKGSKRVYCYEYVKTDNEGIISTDDVDYYFVNFQNDMMGYAKESKAKKVSSNLAKDESYYIEKATKDIMRRYKSWESGPGASILEQYKLVKIYKFNSQYSSRSVYTYQAQCKKSYFSYVDTRGQLMGEWGEPFWENQCFTFSIDRSEMTIWSIDKPENKRYYKLIDLNKFFPK